MYILLRGQVTIYILYAKPSEDGDDGKAKGPTTPHINDEENIRQQLGTFVTNLGECYVSSWARSSPISVNATCMSAVRARHLAKWHC